MTLATTGVNLHQPLHIDSSLNWEIPAKLTQNQELGAQSMLLLDTTHNDIVLTLPDAASVLGRSYTIKKTSHHNEVHLVTHSHQKIDAMSGAHISSSSGNLFPVIHLLSDGEQWLFTGGSSALSNTTLISASMTLPLSLTRVEVDSSSGPIQLILPDVATADGLSYEIVKKFNDHHIKFNDHHIEISGNGTAIAGAFFRMIEDIGVTTLSSNGYIWSLDHGQGRLPFSDNLLAYYPLDENTSGSITNLVDSSKSSGTTHNYIDSDLREAGVMGTGLKQSPNQNVSFDGTGMGQPQQWSVSFWIKILATPTGTSAISYLFGNETSALTGSAIYLSPPNGNNSGLNDGLHIGFCNKTINDTVITWKVFGSTSDLSIGRCVLNQFQHVVMSFDGNSLSLYMNGSLVESVTRTDMNAPFAENAIPNFYIGSNYATPNTNGSTYVLDDIYLHDKALSLSEVVVLKNNF
jgi:hypothetical protein